VDKGDGVHGSLIFFSIGRVNGSEVGNWKPIQGIIHIFGTLVFVVNVHQFSMDGNWQRFCLFFNIHLLLSGKVDAAV
jgi:hypothetical protein